MRKKCKPGQAYLKLSTVLGGNIKTRKEAQHDTE